MRVSLLRDAAILLRSAASRPEVKLLWTNTDQDSESESEGEGDDVAEDIAEAGDGDPAESDEVARDDDDEDMEDTGDMEQGSLEVRSARTLPFMPKRATRLSSCQ